MMRIAVASSFVVVAKGGEVLSDLVTSEVFEDAALTAQEERFWSKFKDLSEKLSLQENGRFFDRADEALLTLDARDPIHGLLTECITCLGAAQMAVLDLSAFTKDEVEALTESKAHIRSPFEQLGSFLHQAYVRVTQGPTQYEKRAFQAMDGRMTKILPSLARSAEDFGSVLTNCRKGTNAAFEIRKFHLYHKDQLFNGQMTCQEVLDVATEAVEVSSRVRKSYMDYTMGLVANIVSDVEDSRKTASANFVTQPPTAAPADAATSEATETDAVAPATAAELDERDSESTPLTAGGAHSFAAERGSEL